MPSVVVTGASTGIGRAIALHLDARATRVFAGVRRSEDGERLRADASDRLEPLILDVTDRAGIEAAASRVEQAVGEAGLAGLVNNAGVAVGAVLEFLEPDDLRRQFEVNVVGVAAVTRSFLPLLRRACGRIVNISSMGGYMAGPFVGPYIASKHAIEGLSDSLRRELRPWGIQVALIEPGSIATPIWEKGRVEGKRMRADLPPRGETLYRPLLDKMDAYVERTAARGIPPEAVARAVERALTASRPRARYRVGADAELTYWLTRLLPDRVMDALSARLIGLPSTPPESR